MVYFAKTQIEDTIIEQSATDTNLVMIPTQVKDRLAPPILVMIPTH